MKRTKAVEWFDDVMKDGTFLHRKLFFEKIGDMEMGLMGEIARKLSNERDEKFGLGVEIGVMIALDRVFNIYTKG
jgi:hypothetical protein